MQPSRSLNGLTIKRDDLDLLRPQSAVNSMVRINRATVETADLLRASRRRSFRDTYDMTALSWDISCRGTNVTNLNRDDIRDD